MEDYKVNLNRLIDRCYLQQFNLAQIDRSFIRVLPTMGKYTRESVKEAMYYNGCLAVEILEYSEATLAKDKKEEAVDVAIFGLNFLVYLGFRTDRTENEVIEVRPCDSPMRVAMRINQLIATLLYTQVDYKQWKFPPDRAVLSLAAEEILVDIAKNALSLLMYECLRADVNCDAAAELWKAILEKMAISIDRANNEVDNNGGTNHGRK